jgi:hypothetical protein
LDKINRAPGKKAASTKPDAGQKGRHMSCRGNIPRKKRLPVSEVHLKYAKSNSRSNHTTEIIDDTRQSGDETP